MKACVIILLLGISCFAADGTRWRFSCPRTTERAACEVFAHTDAVFTATVIRTKAIPFSESHAVSWQKYQRLIVTLNVIEVYRGDVTAGTEIVFDMGDCYYPFEDGFDYLIYANKDDKGIFTQRIGGFTRTRKLSEATEDLEYLRGRSASESGGRIYGKLHDHVQVPALRKPGEKPKPALAVERVKVIAHGEAKTYETVTQVDGKFEFNGVPAGTYRLKANVAPYLSGSETNATLGDKGCANADFSIQATGELRGRVLDVTGGPLGDIEVSIFVDDMVSDDLISDMEEYSALTTSTNKDGSFGFSRLGSGKYRIAVNLHRRSIVYPIFYHPSSLKLTGSTSISLGNGERKENIIIQLPRASK